MIGWANLLALILSPLLTAIFYVKSAGPAELEKKIGPEAYRRCTRYRLGASIFMTIGGIAYVVYFFFPISVFSPTSFPWSWWISALIATVIAIPAGRLWWLGMKAAGEETLFVKREHSLFGGIYTEIRHPQAAGELPYWWVIAFLLHSPFLALFSFVWVPVFLVMCWAEERDLLCRYGRAYEEYRNRTGMFFPRRKGGGRD